MSDSVIDIAPHPQRSVRIHFIGAEKTPLLIIDNLVADPEALIDVAVRSNFTPYGRFFPGVRARAPMEYETFLRQVLTPYLKEHFALGERELKFVMCHYSLVTTPANRLNMLQRIPHFDSVEPNGLASVHYLFKKDLGGTAFYRHRKTGYESIDLGRQESYFRSLEGENDGPNLPDAKYINGDTALYEQLLNVEACFNRLIIYPRNSLHSGSIGENFVPDPNPATGRLSINTFIDMV